MIPKARVKGLEFGLLTTEEVDAIAVTNLTNLTRKKNAPISGTVLDSALGPFNASYRCRTCGDDHDDCQGHFGKMQLFQACNNVLQINLIRKLLHCFCMRCSRLLLSRDKFNRIKTPLDYKKRVPEIYSLTIKQRICWFPSECKQAGDTPRLLNVEDAEEYGFCGFQSPDVFRRMEKVLIRPGYYISAKDKIHQLPNITPNHLFEILRNVDSKIWKDILGFSSPLHSLFFYSFPVAPMIIRPSRSMLSEDDITKTYGDIQKANDDGQHNLDVIPDLTFGLILDEQMEETIVEKYPLSLKFKRTKLGIIPNVLDYFFPLQHAVALVLDTNARVKLDENYNSRERFSFKQRYQNKQNPRFRWTINGKRIDLSGRNVITPCTNQRVDEYGLSVHAAMKQTIREVVTPRNFHRLLEACKNGPHHYPGANFIQRGQDKFLPNANLGGLQMGDEVYRHVVNGDYIIVNRQPSLHRYSLMVWKIRVHNDNTGKLHLGVMKIIGGDFDGDEVTFMTPHDFASMAEAMCLMSVSENLLNDGKLAIGFVQHAVLFSYIFTLHNLLLTYQEMFAMLMEGNDMDLCYDRLAKITTPTLTAREFMHILLPTYNIGDVCDGKALNTAMFRYIQRNIHEGNDHHCRLIGFITRIMERGCYLQGVSLKLKDYLYPIPSSTQEKFQELLHDANTLSQKEPRTLQEEIRVMDTLSRARDVLGDSIITTMKSKKDVGLLDITMSGAKGNALTITQSACCVGLQKTKHSQRHTQHLNYWFVNHIAMYGFVERSFLCGLTPLEFYLHLVSARDGIIGTALSTSVSGYLYRQLWKFVEDLVIGFKNSLRDTNGLIYMFQYGFDTTTLTMEPLVLAKKTIEQVVEQYYNDCIEEVEKLLILRSRVLDLKFVPDTFAWPMNLRFFDLSNISCMEDKVDVLFAYKALNALWTRLVLEYYFPNSELHEAMFFEMFCTKHLMRVGALKSKEHLKEALLFIHQIMTHAICETGTPCGLRCSQSITEPLNQQNLKSCHISGESRPLTCGLQRAKEISNFTEKISTPSMTIVILREYEDQFDPLRILVELYLYSILLYWSDQPIAKQDQPIAAQLDNCSDLVTVTLFLNKEQMIRRKLPPRRVALKLKQSKILNKDWDQIQLQYATLQDERWWIMISIPSTSRIFESPDEPNALKASRLHHALKNEKSLLSGIQNIHDYCKVTKSFQTRDSVGNLIWESRTVYETAGSNLQSVCLLPMIDIQHTTTNDIVQIYQVFGIDATLHAIEHNLQETMVASNTSVSSKHLSVIASCMTQSGKPMPLNFSGMSKKQNVPYLKATTFEQPVRTLFAAATSGYHDPLRGLSESIFAGTKMCMGTGGDFKLISDLSCQPNVMQQNIHKLWSLATQCKPKLMDMDRIWDEWNQQPKIELDLVVEKSKKPLKQKHVDDPLRWGPLSDVFVPSSPKRKEVKVEDDLLHLPDVFCPSSP